MRDFLRLNIRPATSIAREFTLGRLTIQYANPLNVTLWWRT